MSIKISVIVPIYNVDRYLPKCLSSILAQTFRDYEILLIDDGSTDNSADICDTFASKYANVTVIHKENKGPSDARNVGIENAKGEYVYFLDSDDYIIPKCIEILYNNIIKNDADLSCGSFDFFDDNNPINECTVPDNKILIIGGEEACISLLYGKKFYTSSCNILIKKQIAKNNLFPLGKYHEDEMTTFRYFLDAKKIVMTTLKTYYYYQRQGSIMHSFGQPVIDEALAADYYVDICKGKNKRFMKAALSKKYYLYTEIVENYPQIQVDEPEFYDKLIGYLKRNGFSILINHNTSRLLKKRALKYIVRQG